MRRARKTSPRYPTEIEAILVVVLVVVVSVAVVSVAPRLVGTNRIIVNGTLQIGPVVARPPANFWTVDAHAVKIADSGLSALINQTPITTFRYGGGADVTNVTAGLTYSDNGTASPVAGPADSAFVTFCGWRHCHAIFAVPGEINDPGAVALSVRYVETTLGFHPDYWSIGNEPQTWTHFDIPWVKWRGTDASTPTPQEYAVSVQRDIAAMRSVDPTIRVIGIQSSQGGDPLAAWLVPLLGMNGPNIAAVAYHSYPANMGSPDGTEAGFLSAAFRLGFPHDYLETEAEVRAACPKCAIPVFVDEFNGAGVGADNAFDQGYADVPIVAAAIAGGLQQNVSQFSFFDLQGVGTLSAFGLLGPQGTLRPSYYLYSTFFRNLSVGAIQNTTVLGGPGQVAAVVGSNATTVSLMVSNANGTVGLRLGLNGSSFPLTGKGIVWAWDPSLPFPSVSRFAAGSLPASWVIPPEGVLLIDVAT
ncbi:MAG TPA: hypothetical protein VJQ43_00670 [Thermoplasmata archaeon]|nr:hypothetical protein [Thermoplasmata archaeon]